MSRGPENTFISSVHKHVPERVYRMKNHNEYNGGIADCWYSGVNGDLWVEYKFLVVPARDTTVIDLTNHTKFLSVLQQKWLTDRYLEGRSIGVVVGCADGGAIFPGVTWSGPLTAGEFRAKVVTRKAVADWIDSHCDGREIP